MSLNSSHGLSDENSRKFGKFFNTIDFETVQISDYTFESSGRPVGKFHIGNQTYEVSMEELERIADTAYRASEAVVRKRSLGL